MKWKQENPFKQYNSFEGVIPRISLYLNYDKLLPFIDELGRGYS